MHKTNTKEFQTVPFHHSSFDFQLSLWIRCRSHTYCPKIYRSFQQVSDQDESANLVNRCRLKTGTAVHPFNGSTAVQKVIFLPVPGLVDFLCRTADSEYGSVSVFRCFAQNGLLLKLECHEEHSNRRLQGFIPFRE